MKLTSATRNFFGAPGPSGAGPMSIAALQSGDAVAAYKPSFLESLRRELRFAADLEEKYEQDTREQRIAELRLTAPVGAVLYNLVGLTDPILMPDLGWSPFFVRLLLVTPFIAAFVYVLPKVSNRLRERLLAALIGYCALMMVGMVAASSAPLSPYAMATTYLAIIYGTTVFPLRFADAWRCAAAFEIAASVVLLTNVNISSSMTFVLWIQLTIAAFFSVLSVFRMELIARSFYVLTAREVSRASTLATQRDELVVLSNIDALTGISNRGHLDRSMAALFDASARVGRRVTLLLIDIDHFKRYNDHYGHQAGDDCLSKVARELRRQVRGADDIVARYGGEEFAIVLMDLDEQQSRSIANRMCKAVATMRIPHAGRQDVSRIVTISVGVASTTIGASSGVAEFFRDADLALYQAKRAGRNQVSLAWSKAA